jgi:hypothetical protein
VITTVAIILGITLAKSSSNLWYLCWNIKFSMFKFWVWNNINYSVRIIEILTFKSSWSNKINFIKNFRIIIIFYNWFNFPIFSKFRNCFLIIFIRCCNNFNIFFWNRTKTLG